MCTKPATVPANAMPVWVSLRQLFQVPSTDVTFSFRWSVLLTQLSPLIRAEMRLNFKLVTWPWWLNAGQWEQRILLEHWGGLPRKSLKQTCQKRMWGWGHPAHVASWSRIFFLSLSDASFCQRSLLFLKTNNSLLYEFSKMGTSWFSTQSTGLL